MIPGLFFYVEVGDDRYVIENCGSVYLFQGELILLVWHKKFGKWLPAGGHCDEGEDPHQCAKRELFEETGYEAEIFGDDRVEVSRWNAKSLPRPFVVLVEKIPQSKHGIAHEHLDFVYLGRPVKREGHGTEITRWFSRDEIASMEGDVDLFEDTKIIIEKAFEFLLSGVSS